MLFGLHYLQMVVLCYPDMVCRLLLKGKTIGEEMERINTDQWAVGVDLGGTKVKIAQVDGSGRVYRTVRFATRVEAGPDAICDDIIQAVLELTTEVDTPPLGVGVGVPGQISPDGQSVVFAPNLNWADIPLQAYLKNALNFQVSLTNDVRAATIGEWLHGSGRGHDDIVCLFVGTGIGGGIVSSGRLILGCSNNAGELGHVPVELHGRMCHCGNQGCLEAFAGGWAIAQRAQEAVASDPAAGARLLQLVNGRRDDIDGTHVARLFRRGDPLASRIVEETGVALGAGASGLVNAFNPCRLILGGGVIEGIPELVVRVEEEVQRRSLRAASSQLKIVRAALGSDAGVVGAAALAMTVSSLKEG